MGRVAVLLLALIALSGLMLAGVAEARMLPAAAMAAADCPHHAMDDASPAGHGAPAKALMAMSCCFGIGCALPAEMVRDGPSSPASQRLQPASEMAPPSGIVGPDPRPPRA